MQDFPYNTQWKHGRPIYDTTKHSNERDPPDPLKRSIMNVVEEVPWCVACQAPHAPDYCDVAQSIVASPDEQDEEDDEEDQDGMACNMEDSYGKYVYESDYDETELDVDYQRRAYEDYHQ